MSESEDVVYWRTLAEERRRALEVLHARFRDALLECGGNASAFHAGWMRELDRMEPLHELRAADADAVLADLWARVDGDR